MPDENAFSVAHSFDANRLALARELSGLSKADLARRTGRSPSAVTQFESGSLRPDGTTVRELALALGVPVGFFQDSGGSLVRRLPLDDCHFRSLRSAKQRDRRRVLATGSLLLGVYNLVEQHVELPAEDLSRLSNHDVGDGDIEEFAAGVRREWGKGLGPLSAIVSLLESRGVAVMPVAQMCHEVGSFSLWQDGRPCIFLVLYAGAATRTRWDAAHELGHLLLHEDASPGDASLERQADRFAAAFLLPSETFSSECPSRLVWPHFRELKQRWGVSLAALVRRAYDLGKLSEASYRRAFVQLNRSGERYRERGEPELERPQALAKALEMIREDGVSTESVASALGLTRRLVEELIDPTVERVARASS